MCRLSADCGAQVHPQTEQECRGPGRVAEGGEHHERTKTREYHRSVRLV